MDYYKRKRRKRNIVLASIFVVLGIALIASLSYLLYTLLINLDNNDIQSYRIDGEVKGVYLPTGYGSRYSEIEKTIAANESFIDEVVGFCKENQLNTIYFEAKKAEMVFFLDKYFTQSETMSAENSFFKSYDLLFNLCNKANASSIQVVAVVSPYNLQDIVVSKKIEAARKNSITINNKSYYSPKDKKYTEIIKGTLRRLKSKYPIAAIAVDDIEALTAEYSKELSELLNEVKASEQKAQQLAIFYDSEKIGDENFELLRQNVAPDFIVDKLSMGDFSQYKNIPSFADTKTVLMPRNISVSEYKYLLFMQSVNGSNNGCILGSYNDLVSDPLTTSILSLTVAPTMEPVSFGFEMPKAFRVTYPEKALNTTYANCYIMGTSDPTLALTIDGREIERFSTDGTFGVLVALKKGENSFVVSQNGENIAVSIKRNEPPAPVSSYPKDSTYAAKKGDVVRVSVYIGGLLSNKNSDGAIAATLPMGATAIVQDNETTTRSGKTTNVYKLSNGNYLLARNATLVTDYKQPIVSTVTTAKTEYGELLQLCEGAPVVVPTLQEGILNLQLLDTQINAVELVGKSELFSDLEIAQQQSSANLSLNITARFHGYNIIYKDGYTFLELKAKVQKDITAKLPLSGLKIMLDPGHGGENTGALGVAGAGGINEDDVNFAVALATKLRLEQLGANVILSRDANTDPALEERLAMINTEKPDYFISQHHNSIELVSDGNATKGVESYYFYEQSAPLANALVNEISQLSERENRGAKEGYFYVTRSAICPSVLFEYGFMINPKELQDSYSDDGIYKVAYATAQAILTIFFNE